MKVLWLSLMLSLLVGVASCMAAPQKAAVLPERYRDFKVYATSEPDPKDAGRILVTVQFHNEGKRTLQARARLNANAKAGFKGGETTITLAPQSESKWTFELRPADDLRYEVLTGDIFFGNVRAREFYIAVQGPDPADIPDISLDGAVDWEGNVGPSPEVTQRKGIRRITAKAEAVGAYAPVVPGSSKGSTPPARKTPLLTLAAAGRTKYRIIAEPMPRAQDGSQLTPEAWGKVEKPRLGERELAFAVGDLQRCLKLMSDAVLPVTNDAKAPSPAIRLRLNDKRKWAHPDAFHLLTTRGGDVVIESGHLDGLRQGIYSLLTDHLDCHWFLPGQVGEEIPRPANRTVVIGQINEEQKPSFFSVSGMGWGANRDWDWRNRSFINRGRMSFGHSWRSLISPDEFPYDKFPDMWARDRQGKVRVFDTGWSWTNFCPTSPQVLDVVAKKVNASLKNPDVLVASIDPNDYSIHCLCDRCLAVDASFGVTQQDGTYVTDRMLNFSREIYNRLEPENKDKYLGILVYAYQIKMPNKARPHEHHTGIVCHMDWVYDHTRPFNDPTSPQNAEFYRHFVGWSKMLPRMGFYDYYGHYRLFGPWGIVHKFREDLPAFRDMGGTYLMIEAQPNFAMHGFNLYIASQLTWNVDADVDALMEEFFTKFYGPAAEPMRKYWLAIERRYALARPGPDAIDRVTANPELWRELDGYLKQAEAIVAGADQRFRNRITFNRDGFEMGRRQHELIRKYAQPAAELNYEQTVAYVKEGTQWLSEMKKKYPSADGYYPSLIASYLYSGLEGPLAELEVRAKAKQ
ncbi:MAG TPA: DUF4838 domain-containing protein [Abditibacteriaceae bacterium]|nr:DUF4838 domain-containing protein [Abditibacteriaceae bacterium]